MIADSTDIKFACSKCGQHIVVHRSGAGLKANCPICEHPVVVPQASMIAERSFSGEPEHASKRPPFAEPDADQMREELFNAAVENGQIERELDEAKAEIARLSAVFKKAVDECERLTANTTHAHAEIKSFQADRQQLKSDLAQAKQRALAAESKLGEAQARADELAAALADAGSENAALRERIEHDLTLARERLAAAETQLEIRERELRESRLEATELVQSLAAGQAELSALRTEASGLRGELESAQALLDEAAQTARKLAESEKELQGKLQTAEASQKNLSGERDQLREQADGLRRDLAEVDKGRELLELRSRVPQLEAERDRAAVALAEKIAETKAQAEAEQKLLRELHEAVALREDAERRADAAAEHQVIKDNEVLRGIIERQNETLRVHHVDLRRFRRSRDSLRILYVSFGLGLILLASFAVMVFSPHGLGGLFRR